ncbi:MAG: SufE family protein [Cytophagaceae bacterium]
MGQSSDIDKTQNEIAEDFYLLEEWDDKYTYIIELGKQLKGLSEEHKTEENKIKGCQSQVWLHSYFQDDKVFYEADSDAMIVKGLVFLLIKILSGNHPDEIINTELNFLEKIGMKQHLSPTRSNGLAAMVKQMKLHALAYKSKIDNEHGRD